MKLFGLVENKKIEEAKPLHALIGGHNKINALNIVDPFVETIIY